MTKKSKDTKDIEVSAPTKAADPTDAANMSYAELNRVYRVYTKKNTFGDYRMIGLGGDGEDTNGFAEFRLTGHKVPRSGWKAHFSVNANDLGKAWDAAYPVMVKLKVPEFKVFRQNVAAIKGVKLVENGQLTTQQRNLGTEDLLRLANGTQITIYVPEGAEKDAQKWFKEVESALSKAKIKTGTLPKSDRPLGKYCSIRYEGKTYKSHDQVSSYNDEGVPDPFKEV